MQNIIKSHSRIVEQYNAWKSETENGDYWSDYFIVRKVNAVNALQAAA